MNKQDADKCIFEYLDKIFGFSLDKMKSIEQAQELASDIVYQVYLSFLKKDDILQQISWMSILSTKSVNCKMR